jgi:hypothetical protein
MAEDKKSFVLYADLIHTVSKMPSDKAGELFKHILSYVNDEDPVTEDLIIQLTFEPIKQQLKRDLVKYEKKKTQWSEAGKRSAEARKAKKNERTLTDVEKRSTDLTVSVNDSVNVTHYTESVFLENWTKCREHYLKKTTNIKKLNLIESNEFNAIKKLYSKEEINEAMQTLFKQERIPVDAMVLRPKHFLEKFDTYYTGKNNTKIYGANV